MQTVWLYKIKCTFRRQPKPLWLCEQSKTSCVGSSTFTESPLCTAQYLVTLDASCPREMKDRKRPVVRQYTQQVKEQLRTFKELTSAFLRRRNKQVGRKKRFVFTHPNVLCAQSALCRFSSGTACTCSCVFSSFASSSCLPPLCSCSH